MLSRTSLFKSFINHLASSVNSSNNLIKSLPSNSGSNYSKFMSLGENSKIELLSAIKSLQSYSINTKKSNDRRRKLFKLMTWRQQKLCEDIGYLKKLKKIDRSISINQILLDDIIENSIKNYGISFHDFNILKHKGNNQNTSSTNYRVIETLGHFVRDWSPEGDVELQPMLSYIKKQLDLIIPTNERSKTCIIVPGPGLGRIAHEIASLGSENSFETFGSVHAVEYSGLMHICNEFIYSLNNKSYEIYPYIHSCSNFVKTQSQFRSSNLNTNLTKPSNLYLNHEDFRYFNIPNKDKFENVVVISAFFIDTAENLVDYLDRIQSLTVPNFRNSNIKNGYWINIGPLKYGSAAQVELNVEELTALRQKMGWDDIDVINTLNNPRNYGENGLVGYITDKESMWQGYYGLSMWTSKRKENKRQ